MAMDVTFPEGVPSGILLVRAEGEIDLYSASEFAALVLGRLQVPVKTVVLDFSGVSYLDSSGTGAVIRILYRARGIGARLLVAGLRVGPRQVLRMVNILPLIGAYGTAEEAIASAGGDACSSAGN
jgi:anti-anti-sigma factor